MIEPEKRAKQLKEKFGDLAINVVEEILKEWFSAMDAPTQPYRWKYWKEVESILSK